MDVKKELKRTEELLKKAKKNKEDGWKMYNEAVDDIPLLEVRLLGLRALDKGENYDYLRGALDTKEVDIEKYQDSLSDIVLEFVEQDKQGENPVAVTTAALAEQAKEKSKRGRKPGSKNKPKTVDAADSHDPSEFDTGSKVETGLDYTDGDVFGELGDEEE